MKTSDKRLDILYRDDYLIAVHKPPGIHVHPTALSRGEDSCMRILRDQIGRWVYPVHRLDRATSGVLLFALSSRAADRLIRLFTERRITKRYLAVVRGWVEEEGEIDHPLREEKHKPPAGAITRYRRLATVEFPWPVGQFDSARYSLVAVFPVTGRKNQIRKHFAHIGHPIIGDVQYGDGRHNRLFREKFALHRLLLLATTLSFIHPYTDQSLSVYAPPAEDVQEFLARVGWEKAVGKG